MTTNKKKAVFSRVIKFSAKFKWRLMSLGLEMEKNSITIHIFFHISLPPDNCPVSVLAVEFIYETKRLKIQI